MERFSRLPRSEKPQIEILTREEQQKLIYTSYKYRYSIFIRLTLATGIRLGELLGLRWDDIDFSKNMLSIRRTLNRLPKVNYNDIGNSTEIVIQEPKTKNSTRSIPVIQSIVNELQQWKNVQHNDAMAAGTAYFDSGFLVTNPFGGYIEPRTFKDFYDEMLEASGLKHYTFHALRHTFATRAMEQGMDAKLYAARSLFGFIYPGYLHPRSRQPEAGRNEGDGGILFSANCTASTILCDCGNADAKWLSTQSC